MTSTQQPRDGDFVVVTSGGALTFAVAKWPHSGKSTEYPPMPRIVARAYACDLARQAQTSAWDMSGDAPERLDCAL